MRSIGLTACWGASFFLVIQACSLAYPVSNLESGDAPTGDGGMCGDRVTRCSADLAQSCQGGIWSNTKECNPTEARCSSGKCVPPPNPNPDQIASCSPNAAGADGACGKQGDHCCASRLILRSDSVTSLEVGPETSISSFDLDRFEVTVGRFRHFVNSYRVPKLDEGSHSNIPGSGWKASYSKYVPLDVSALKSQLEAACPDQAAPYVSTWTATAGANEKLPMNCVNWYVALAFCIWDGGSLPTIAEWSLAVEGSDLRDTPWGGDVSTAKGFMSYCDPDSMTAKSCLPAQPVGSYPTGKSAAGIYDLYGNVAEYTLDTFADATELQLFVESADALENAAHISSSAAPMVYALGYSALDTVPQNFSAASWALVAADQRSVTRGFRCARP